MWFSKKNSVTFTYTDNEVLITSSIADRDVYVELMVDLLSSQLQEDLARFCIEKHSNDKDLIEKISLVLLEKDSRKYPIVRPSEFLQ